MTQAIVARKVAEVRKRIARVRELLPRTAEEFRTQRTAAEALLLNLYLAVQASCDLALHVVADRGLGVPSDVRGAFECLVSGGIIDPALGQRMAGAIGLGNRIAHQYGTLDLDLVFRVAHEDLGDLEAFAAIAADAYQV